MVQAIEEAIAIHSAFWPCLRGHATESVVRTQHSSDDGDPSEVLIEEIEVD